MRQYEARRDFIRRESDIAMCESSRTVDSEPSEAKMIVTNYTTEDLKKLPLRAIVALIARCARRVEQLALPPDDHPESTALPGGRGERHPTGRGLREGLALPIARIVVREIESCRAVAEGDFVRESAMETIVLAAHAAATRSARARPPQRARGIAHVRGRQAQSLSPPGGCHGRPGRARRLHGGVDSSRRRSGTSTPSSRGPSRIMKNCCSSTSGSYPQAGKPIDPSSPGPLGPF